MRPADLPIARSVFLLTLIALAAPASRAQEPLWGYRLGGVGSNQKATDIAAVPGGAGDFYACGGVDDGINFTFGSGTSNLLSIPTAPNQRGEAFVAKYDSEGTPLWVRLGRGARFDRASAVSAWADGHVLAGGSYNLQVNGVPSSAVVFEGGTNPDTTVTPGGSRIFMARYEEDGDLVFARKIMSTGTTGAEVRDLATLDAISSDGYFVVGSFRGGVFGDTNDPSPIDMPLGASFGFQSSDGFVARYAPNGDILWVERIKGAAADVIAAAGVMPDGDLILLGSAGRRDILDIDFFPGHPAATTRTVVPEVEGLFVLRLDFAQDPTSQTSAFTVQWLHTFGGQSAGNGLHDIEISPSGDLYIAGYLPPDPNEPDPKDPMGPPIQRATTYDGVPLLPGVPANHGYFMRLNPDDGEVEWACGTSTGASDRRPDVAAFDDGAAIVMRTGGFPTDFFYEDGTVWATQSSSIHARISRDGVGEWAREDSTGVERAVASESGTFLTTGASFVTSRLDLGEPTELQMPPPTNDLLYIAKYASGPACPEDSFEENDSCLGASPITEGLYADLSTRKEALDSDWYSITVENSATLEVDVLFSDAEGDIDLALFTDCAAPSVLVSETSDDNESLTWLNDTGVRQQVLIHVYLASTEVFRNCNTYDLNIGFTGGSGTDFVDFCFGDGSGTPCPCGNEVTAGSQTGCANSTGGGATLLPTGTSSVSADGLEFSLVGGEAQTFALLWSGDNKLASGLGIPFINNLSDGLRCMGGMALRHGVRMTDATGATFNTWGPGIIAQGPFVSGQTRHFQVFYRKLPSTVCLTGLNTTQAVSVTFVP